MSDFRKVLILCKTYPSPSAKYVETSCVAGVDDTGQLIRIFPVPFRLVDKDQQFKKWQWINARIIKARDDHRPESHHISVDTIEILGEPLDIKNGWQTRRAALDGVAVFDDFDQLELARQSQNITLGLLRPDKLIDIEIKPVAQPEWTEDEIAKLMQEQNQGNLFDEEKEKQALRVLRKLPYDFYYHYECKLEGVRKTFRHKLVDWEAGALYWNIYQQTDWQEKFKAKLLEQLGRTDIHFLMGTIHRFPDQWLIVSVIYPPKPQGDSASQALLF